ncbi:hypothetical protein H0H92_006364, partial [Tricholoma furcatifolium]
MSYKEPSETQVKKLCAEHESKMLTIVSTKASSKKNPELFEAMYTPFFRGVCELYGIRDDIPVPPGDSSAWLMYQAWKAGDFEEILDYINKKLESSVPVPQVVTIQEAEAAWKTPYVGNSHDLLRDAIDEIRLQKSFRNPTPKYGNFFAIIQGTGTGKSRTVYELSKYVFTIPFVLRKAEDKSGYPVMDTYQIGASERPVLDLFQHAHDWLNKPTNSDLSLEETISSWQQHLKLEQSNLHDHMAHANQSLKDMLGLELDSDGKLIMTDINTKVLAYTENVVKLLEKRKTEEDPDPYILFAFDEAHNLTMDRTTETDGSMSRTPYQCLCKALSYFRGAQVFALFLSTYSRLSEFSPSNRNFWSSRPTRQAGEEVLHPPFVELPFDIGPKALKGILVQENAHAISEICTVAFMTRFGRPLQKLDVSHDGNLSLPYSVDEPNLLPLLAIRVDLTFESNRDEAIYLESLLVASSSRTVYSVPRHRQYLRGSYPSEPLLAEAASQKLHQVFSQPASTTATALNLEELKNIYKTKLPGLLNKWLASGLISKGERGELVARLLLTLAHDLAVLNMRESSDIVKFSRKIPVVDFLSALISPQYVEQVLNAKPCNLKSEIPLLDAFQDAFVHFTHFVKGDDNSIVTDEA